MTKHMVFLRITRADWEYYGPSADLGPRGATLVEVPGTVAITPKLAFNTARKWAKEGPELKRASVTLSDRLLRDLHGATVLDAAELLPVLQAVMLGYMKTARMRLAALPDWFAYLETNS